MYRLVWYIHTSIFYATVAYTKKQEVLNLEPRSTYDAGAEKWEPAEGSFLYQGGYWRYKPHGKAVHFGGKFSS